MSLHAESARLTTWLEETALPLWRARGFAGTEVGFVETVGMDGQATADPLRARVPPRQIYCFAEAGRRGWQGDWRAVTEDGLAAYDRAFLTENGHYGAKAGLDGHLVDATFDLYNQAFALLAFATIAAAEPARSGAMADRSAVVLTFLEAHYRHPVAGFEEAAPSRVPLCSNPHMHLFEACLASEERPDFDSVRWVNLTDEIASLCMDHFVDPQSGVLREFFDADWSPMPDQRGRIVEPGHLFEWAWLLVRYAERRADARAIETARRLFDIAETHGVPEGRTVAVMTLLDDLTIADPIARLWPQTEWLKASMRLAALTQGEERARYLASAHRAIAALQLFLEVPMPGLWRDKQRPDGTFVEEAAPASSLYHIVCAIYELQDCLGRL